MAEQDPNVQESSVQEPTPYVTAEMAWEMSKRAAAEAREEAIKEALALRETQAQTQNSRDSQNNRGTQNNRNTQDGRDTRNSRDIQDDRDDDYDDRRSRKRRRRDDDEEEDLVGFSPKLVKQLQTTVGVFNTLKDFASNPMQKAIEDRIGGLAAGIIEQAFTSPRGPPQKRDMVDTLLNSQMAFGLGQGLGSRAPELVESLSKSFGREKAENMIEGMIGKYSGGERKKIEPANSDKSPSPEPSRSSPEPQRSEDQSNIELLLSLDPNNPEHVSAYSESQGGISIDVARKMLMIHQDDIIKRMKSQGADTTVIESQRGSRVGQDNPEQRVSPQKDTSVHKVDVSSDYDAPSIQPVQKTPPPVQPIQQIPYGQQIHDNQQIHPIHQTFPVQQTSPVQQSSIKQPNSTQENMQYIEPDLDNELQDFQHGHEYTEYNDIGKQDNTTQREKDLKQQNDNIKQQEKNLAQDFSNSQQVEMMKSFSEDIGKVMGDVIGKIENLNNTVFNLQNELNEVKKQKIQTSPTQYLEQRSPQKPRSAKDFFPDDFEREPDSETSIPDLSLRDTENLEELPQKKIEEYRSTQDFFPEKVQNINDFEKELEEETRRAIQLTKKIDTDKSPKVDIKDKEVEIIKKPIMSMINKKKVGYSLKQKQEDVQPENSINNKNDDKKNDKISENKNSGNNENGENSENDNDNKNGN